MEACDRCGCAIASWTELKLEAELWADFLQTFENFHNKEPEGGAFIFRFCLVCVFENPATEADERRMVSLVKEVLGLGLGTAEPEIVRH
jgi:hypothetical protein